MAKFSDKKAYARDMLSPKSFDLVSQIKSRQLMDWSVYAGDLSRAVSTKFIHNVDDIMAIAADTLSIAAAADIVIPQAISTFKSIHACIKLGSISWKTFIPTLKAKITSDMVQVRPLSATLASKFKLIMNDKPAKLLFSPGKFAKAAVLIDAGVHVWHFIDGAVTRYSIDKMAKDIQFKLSCEVFNIRGPFSTPEAEVIVRPVFFDRMHATILKNNQLPLAISCFDQDGREYFPATFDTQQCIFILPKRNYYIVGGAMGDSVSTRIIDLTSEHTWAADIDLIKQQYSVSTLYNVTDGFNNSYGIDDIIDEKMSSNINGMRDELSKSKAHSLIVEIGETAQYIEDTISKIFFDSAAKEEEISYDKD